MSHGASDQAGAPSASGWGRLAPPAHWRLSKVFQPVQRPLGVDTRRFLIDLLRLVHWPCAHAGRLSSSSLGRDGPPLLRRDTVWRALSGQSRLPFFS